jgi:hypothetical protein
MSTQGVLKPFLNISGIVKLSITTIDGIDTNLAGRPILAKMSNLN